MQYFAVLTAILFLSGCRCDDRYYWREYYGKIPDDALLVGKDIKGGNVYVGQVFLKDKGLIVCRIVAGEKEVTAPYGGINKTDKNIKILCGSAEDFEWIKSSYQTISSDVKGKELVVGGYSDGDLYVGRLFYKGETKVGKVTLPEVYYPYIFFDDDGVERRIETYELLTLKSKAVEKTEDKNLDKTINDLFGP